MNLDIRSKKKVSGGVKFCIIAAIFVVKISHPSNKILDSPLKCLCY